MVKLTDIKDVIGEDHMDCVEISDIPEKYRSFIHPIHGPLSQGGMKLVIPHDLFVEMCKEAEGEYF